jgi:hypothetical protein
MPYSATFKQQIQELVDEELGKIKFQQSSDFADFSDAAKILIDPETVISTASYQEQVADLKETLIDYGFDYYATEGILDISLRVLDVKSKSRELAFVPKSDQTTKAENLQEARDEFKTLILTRLSKRLSEFKNMSEEKKIQYIARQNEEKQHADKVHKILLEHPEPTAEQKRIPESAIENAIRIRNAIDAFRYRFPNLIAIIVKQKLPTSIITTFSPEKLALVDKLLSETVESSELPSNMFHVLESSIKLPLAEKTQIVSQLSDAELISVTFNLKSICTIASGLPEERLTSYLSQLDRHLYSPELRMLFYGSLFHFDPLRILIDAELPRSISDNIINAMKWHLMHVINLNLDTDVPRFLSNMKLIFPTSVLNEFYSGIDPSNITTLLVQKKITFDELAPEIRQDYIQNYINGFFHADDLSPQYKAFDIMIDIGAAEALFENGESMLTNLLGRKGYPWLVQHTNPKNVIHIINLLSSEQLSRYLAVFPDKSLLKLLRYKTVANHILTVPDPIASKIVQDKLQTLSASAGFLDKFLLHTNVKQSEKEPLAKLIEDFYQKLAMAINHLENKSAPNEDTLANKQKKLEILTATQKIITKFMQLPQAEKQASFPELVATISDYQTSIAKIPHVGKFNTIFKTASTQQKVFNPFLKEARCHLPEKQTVKKKQRPGHHTK